MTPSLRLELQQERLCECGLPTEGENEFCSDCLAEIERDSKDNPFDESWRFS